MTQVQVSLATKHGKLTQIAPAFRELLGWEVRLAELDTDEFGSFDGTKPRLLSPRETVLAKAKAGAELLGLRFGLASEGTIGAHPQFPFSTSDAELIGFVDLELKTELVISHISPKIVAQKLEITDSTSLELLAEKFDLPKHALNLTIESALGKRIVKGIFDSQTLAQEVSSAKQVEGDVRFLAESDFRAMSSPSRQQNIADCARKAAERIAQNCPACHYLGFGQTDFEYGVVCSGCGTLNQHVVSAEIHGCLACAHLVRIARSLTQIEPDRCLSCNP